VTEQSTGSNVEERDRRDYTVNYLWNWEKTRKPSVNIESVSAEIRTDHFPSTSLKCCCLSQVAMYFLACSYVGQGKPQVVDWFISTILNLHSGGFRFESRAEHLLSLSFLSPARQMPV
jgi:hypothetical protein